MGCDSFRFHPDPKTARYHVLISLMLSSQTKDEKTEAAMRELMEGPGLTVEKILKTSEETIKTCIYGVSFHNRKAQYIKKATAILKEKHHSDVPDNLTDLMALPGVGPKMAYLCMQQHGTKQLGLGLIPMSTGFPIASIGLSQQALNKQGSNWKGGCQKNIGTL
eukprot:CAMPEP_0174263054 /NCGR_PEP_ID=MMETSP0439-20130205/17041_1 /TAXON_ID=0 /ORGANISM="Stereomyxa ramosa, Strain Chinc5" /LENGTH=163 /DNA_ID=CAMNT_0015348183 /DNA_START=207 /DNA_END=699 /DNA_ORIENTATION=+